MEGSEQRAIASGRQRHSSELTTRQRAQVGYGCCARVTGEGRQQAREEPETIRRRSDIKPLQVGAVERHRERTAADPTAGSAHVSTQESPLATATRIKGEQASLRTAGGASSKKWRE